MNDPADHDIDLVRKAYRASSSETAPDALNRAVLREADRAAKSARLALPYAWYRPIAFAAVLVIGVSLIYDMQRVLQPTDMPAVPLRENRADSVAPPLLQDSAPATVNTKPMLLKPGAASSPPAAARQRDAALSESVEATETRRIGAGSDPHAPTSSPQTQRAMGARRAESLQSTVAPATLKDAVSDACAGQYRDAPEAWWHCVQQLRAAGETEAADEEWQLLKANYPEFVATE